MQLQDKKKAAILAALTGILAVYWGYKLFFGHEPPVAAPVNKAAPARQAAGRLPGTVKVDLDLLDRPKDAYNAGRNMFIPVYKKPTLPKPSAAAGGAGGQPITVTPQQALPPLPPPPPPRSQEEIDADNAKEEMNKFRVLGFLKRKGKTDVFLGLGNSHFIAEEGGNITKEYYLAEIGGDFITIQDKKTDVQVQIKADFEGGKNAGAIPMPGSSGGLIRPSGGGPQQGAPSGAPPAPGSSGPRHYSPGSGVSAVTGGGTAVTVSPQPSAPQPLQNRSVK